MARKTTKKAPSKPRKTAKSASRTSGVKIRMYRQGLGDCFLITLPRKSGKPYFILIDCGVILGTSDAVKKMSDVVKNIIETTSGHVDLLLSTHEHWDHLSGFIQAQDLFSGLKVDEVWLAWTEDPEDKLANELRAEHMKMRMALTTASARMHFAGASTAMLDGLLEFFGAAGSGTTGDALKVVKGLCKTPRFCRPDDKPVELDGVDARLYILGPPHDRAAIKRFNPSKAHPETYGMADVYMNQIAPSITGGDADAPFDPIAQIPMELAKGLLFFQTYYWGEDAGSVEKDQSWRRIDGDWMDYSSSLALQLDSATNNTSLVLAIELGNGDVLLFVADAQVGNWLSWQDLKWKVGGQEVTGPDLLARTIVYKVGHHGSHNATLQEKGLELMKKLKIAFIPVDHDMAVKKRWGKMPLEQIEKRLDEITNGAVLRVDKDVPAALKAGVNDANQELYYEVEL